MSGLIVKIDPDDLSIEPVARSVTIIIKNNINKITTIIMNAIIVLSLTIITITIFTLNTFWSPSTQSSFWSWQDWFQLQRATRGVKVRPAAWNGLHKGAFHHGWWFLCCSKLVWSIKQEKIFTSCQQYDERIILLSNSLFPSLCSTIIIIIIIIPERLENCSSVTQFLASTCSTSKRWPTTWWRWKY